jgi:hypothetical protein
MAVSRNTVIGGLSSVFLLPSFILTVVPTAAYDLAQATAMAFGVVALPIVPFAFRRASTITRILLVPIGVALAIFNFLNATDAFNRTHASALDVQARLADLSARRKDIPAHGIATKGAVEDARKARDRECDNGLGPRCRDRESALAMAQRDAAATEHAAVIQADLDHATAERTQLAPAEETAKHTADQISDLAGIPSEKIAKHRSLFKAAIVELLGGVMPAVMVLVFGKGAPSKPRPLATASRDTVTVWFAECIERRPGKRLRAKKAFESYRAWCRKNKHDPVSLRAFGDILRDQIKVKKQTTRGYTYYLDCGLADAWDFILDEATDEQREAARQHAKPKLTVVPVDDAAESEGRQSRGNG